MGKTVRRGKDNYYYSEGDGTSKRLRKSKCRCERCTTGRQHKNDKKMQDDITLEGLYED